AGGTFAIARLGRLRNTGQAVAVSLHGPDGLHRPASFGARGDKGVQPAIRRDDVIADRIPGAGQLPDAPADAVEIDLHFHGSSALATRSIAPCAVRPLGCCSFATAARATPWLGALGTGGFFFAIDAAVRRILDFGNQRNRCQLSG